MSHLHLIVQEILIEYPLCYCSRHYVPGKMDLPLPCLGRSNTNGFYLLGRAPVALEVSYFVEYKQKGKYGMRLLTTHIWGVAVPFLFMVCLQKKYLFIGKPLCARQRSSHGGWGCG